MCTLLISYEPDRSWSLVLAGNRDEMRDRPARRPRRHWHEYPGVVGGLDCQAGGSWAGINDDGLVGVMLNREGSLGPERGKRSRGELTLKALAQPSADLALTAVSRIDSSLYRPFNLFVGDRRSAYWARLCRSDPEPGVEIHALTPGSHILTARDLDDSGDPRIRAWLPYIEGIPRPEPGGNDWGLWCSLLGRSQPPGIVDPGAVLNLRGERFGTVSSFVLAIPNVSASRRLPVWWFADGPPHLTEFAPVDLTASLP